MVNVSNEFKKQLAADNRNYLEYADITLKDGTVLNLTNKDLWNGGLSIEDAVSSDNSFDIGAAIINKCELTINNIYDDFTDYVFEDAEVIVSVGLELPDGTIEKIRKGTYAVDEPSYNGSIITLSCLDNMRKFDRSYSESKLTYPATLNAIVRDACSVCGVTLQTESFPHDDFVIQTRPTDEATTFREVISWVAQIAGCFCRCDAYGRLELKWYDQTALENPAVVDWSVGENLLLRSDTRKIGAFSGAQITFETGVAVTEWGATDAIRAYGTGGTNAIIGTMGGGLSVPDKSVNSEKYVHSIYIKNNASKTISITNNGLGVSYSLRPGAAEKVVLYGTGNGTQNLQINFSVPAAGDAFDFVYWHPKIEIGTEATNWTNSPSEENAHWLKSNYSAPVVSLDDVVITGVRVVEKNESEDTEEQLTTYQSGTDGYVISIEDNELIKGGAGQTVAGWLGEQLIGLKFRKATVNHASDPTIEAGDIAVVTDRKGNNYNIVVSTTKFSTGSSQNTVSAAENPARNSAARYSVQTKNYVEWRKAIEKEKSEREKALEALGERLENSPGVFTTVETQADGSKIYYLHNKPNLSESDIVWKMTAEAWGVSTDGGETWNAGMTVDGDTIVRILTATGVNADWLNAGAITVKDSSGNIIFSVDMDTKQVIISGDSVRIGGKTATTAINDVLVESKDYSDGKLADYANTVTANITNLQSQIDGQIETFYYDYEPTLLNYPASEWTTTAERQKHEGDLFYWKSKGYAYRFFQDGATWKWQLVQDTDITQAMAAAEKAQDTADGKRRVFVVTPQPPYDIGDLWTNGTDILTCAVARAHGSVYVSSDWQKLNKYTDDTVANQALTEAQNARNLNIILDNEYQGIPTDYEGNYTTFPTCQTFVQVLYGHTDVSTSCTYTTAKSSGVTGSWNNTTRTYTVTGLTTDNGWVDITASYLNLFTTTKRFNIAKVKDGSPGINGADGVGVKSSTVTYQASTSGTTAPTGTWSTTIPTVSAGQYLWTRTVITYTDNTTSTLYSVGRSGTNGTNGAAGKGISSITNYYLATASGSGVTTATTGWTTTIQTITATNKYLWNYEVVKYTDNTTTTTSPVIIGAYGDQGATGAAGSAGRGISSITEYYLVSSSASGITTSTSGWSTSIVNTTTTNKYLWNYEKITYTDNTSVNTTPKIIGTHGATGATGTAGRTYFMEPSTLVVKRSKDNSMAPNYITLSAYYRDGATTARTAYSGRFKIEESLDGDTWTTIYISSANESSITHSLYSVLATSAGGAISTASGKSIGIPRDVVALRCTLYAAGGTTQMLDIQSIAVVLDVDALTAEEVLEILSDGWQGIYSAGDKYYISAEFIKTGEMLADRIRGGILTLGGTNNANGALNIVDTSGNVIGTWNKDGFNATKGAFSGDITGSSGKFYGIISSSYTGKTVNVGDGEISFVSPDYSYTCGKISGKETQGTNFGTIVICNANSTSKGEVGYKDEDIVVSINMEFTCHNPATFESYMKVASSINCGSLYVNGVSHKSKIFDTENYETRVLNCYETPSPMFGDVGFGKTDDGGICIVSIDDIFSETISSKMEYHIFLQKEGQGDIWVDSKESTFFVVKGTPNLNFSWELKAFQDGFECERLDEFISPEEEESVRISEIDYETEYIDEIHDLSKEREMIYDN